MLALCSCVRADQSHKRFDIAAQPAASALNEFARQADVTLIFSYDLVTGVQSQPLQGRYSIDDGLARLLLGTPLVHRRSTEGAYLICLFAACEPRVEQSSARSPPQ